MTGQPDSIDFKACFEGLIRHNIAEHDGADPRPTFDLVLRAALG